MFSSTVILRKTGRFLSQVADAGASPLVHRRVGQLDAVQSHAALVRTDEARNKVEGRGLSRPVGAEKPHDFPLLDPDAHLVHHAAALEALRQIEPLEHAGEDPLRDKGPGPLDRPAGRSEQCLVYRLPLLRRGSPPGHPGADRLPVAGRQCRGSSPRWRVGAARSDGGTPAPRLRDLLIRTSQGLVAGEVGLTVAQHQVRECDAVRRAGSADDGRQRDGHRRVPIAERGNPFGRRRGHRLTPAGERIRPAPERVAAGGRRRRLS